MEHKFIIETSIDEEQLTDLLSNAFQMQIGFDTVDWDEGDYKMAKQSLADGKVKPQYGELGDGYCTEEVLARLLFLGRKIKLEEAETENWKSVGLEDICRGIKQYIQDGYNTGCKSVQSLIDDGDSIDADAVLQYAAYGEVIYG